MPRAKLSNVSTKQLLAEIEKRMSRLPALIARRDELDRQIAALQAVPMEAPTEPVPAEAGRKPKAKSLGDYVGEVLDAAPKALALKEIETSVRAAGYPTKAKSLYVSIAKALAKGGFKKVGRGVYAGMNAVGLPEKAAPAPAPKPRVNSADEFVLGLIKGKGSTSEDLQRAWVFAGRAGKIDGRLKHLVNARKIKRDYFGHGRGSFYTLA